MDAWRTCEQEGEHLRFFFDNSYSKTTMECHNLPLDDEKYRSKLQQIQHLWQSYNECPKIVRLLDDCFTTSENPYVVALFLMANSEDFHLSKKSSLSFFVMTTFKNWVMNNTNDLKLILTTDVKLNSFFIVFQQKNLQLIKMVAEIFHLEEENELFLPYIREQLMHQKFKQACENATVLKLHSYFTTRDFLIQLIFQDKLTVVENFLQGSPEHQREVVKFMDELLGNSNEQALSERISCLSKEMKINDAKLSKFKAKCLSKLIGRYMKMYDVSSDLCPNYVYQQKRRALGFLVAKRFIDRTLEGESWNEMMLDIVKGSTELQLKLIDLLIDYCELEEAFNWFKHFGLNMENLPSNLRVYGQGDDTGLKAEEEPCSPPVTMEESWDDDTQPSAGFKPPVFTSSNAKKGKSKKKYCNSPMCDDILDMETSTGSTTYNVADSDGDNNQDEEVVGGLKNLKIEHEPLEESIPDDKMLKESEESFEHDAGSLEYYHLPLHEDDIVTVDTPECFKELLEGDVKEVEVVGLDCEWKPSFTAKKNSVALMQLATKSKVFLIDVLSFSENHHCLWADFNANVLENERIIKLGFDLNADKSMVLGSIPPLKGFGSSSFLDLSTLWKVLANNPSFSFPFQVGKEQSGKSLAQLVYVCFGKTLDKSDQFSNWERRPLRRSQRIYAALDAHCLLEVYDYLKNAFAVQNIPFEEIVSASMKESKYSKVKQHKSRGKKQRKIIDPMSFLGMPSVNTNSKYPPITTQSIRMICDKMLQGLGKKLRSCGVDTWNLQPNDDTDTCVKIAFRDRRIILTRGSNYGKYAQFVGPDYCYDVKGDLLEDQVKEVLRHFNIVLKKEDIFSRCQVCNGSEFAEIHNSLMKDIVSLATEMKDEPLDCAGSDQMGDAVTAPVRGKKWLSHSAREMKEVTNVTHRGVPIKCNNIPVGVLLEVEYFYACEKCGKVYWDGSHWQNELNRKRENNLIG